MTDIEELDTILMKFETTVMGTQGDSIHRSYARQQVLEGIVALIVAKTTEAEERGRDEVFKAIEEGRLVVRQFITKEELKNQYPKLQALSEEDKTGE